MAKTKPAKKKPAAKARPAAKKKAPAGKAGAKPAAKPGKAGKKPRRKAVIPPPIKGVAEPLVPIIPDDQAPAPAAEPAAPAAKPASVRRLKPADSTEIRELLLKRREQLLNEIREELDKSKVAAQKRSADPTDQASDSADGDLALALAQSDSAELVQIDAALARSDAGELGVCDECGNTIPMERLRVLPYATTCTQCRRKLEQQGEGDNLEEAWEAVSESEEEQEGEEQ